MKGTVMVTCDAVGEHEVRAVAELLDDAEDVVPAAGVEPARVLAELVEDLVHLERGEDRLDQHGRPDRAAGDAERVLRGAEDVVPQARLEVALELGQVEVRAEPALEQLARVPEEVEAEVEEAAPRSARRRRARASRAGASRAGARAAPPSRRSAGTTCRRACSSSMVRRTASWQFDLALDARSPRSASSRPRSRP